MKRLLLFCALFLAFGTMAQNFAIEQDRMAEKNTRPIAKPISDNNPNRATPFWTEDFGNGIPATWSVLDSSGICPWVFSTDGSWGNFSVGGTTAAAPAISSTTSSNGFIICDNDSANHFTYGQPSGANYQYLSSYIGTSAIDCSGHSSVILSFEHLFRYNNSVALNVKVSNDNVNWTIYNVSGGLANNATSADPQLTSLNITSIAANQPTVYIQFGWSARVYFWMIDDIALSEADPFDVANNDTWWEMGNLGYQYYKIPLTHAAPISFNSDLYNNTGAQLSNCQSVTEVSGTTGIVFTGTSNAISIVAAANDTVTSSTSWTPVATGFYEVNSVASSSSGTDGNPSNNAYDDSLMITSSTFGLDNLTDASQSTGAISNFSSNTGQAFKIGNIYQVTINDVVECVQIGIADEVENEGKEIFAEVYAFDQAVGSFVFRGATASYQLTSADVGTILSLEMVAPAEVFANEEILVVAGHYGGDPSGSEDVSFMYGQSVPEQTVYGYNSANDLFFLSNPRAIVVRPDFNCGLGLDDQAQLIETSLFPNPANNEFTLRLANEISVGTITMTDMSGRVVMTKAVNSILSEVQIDATKIASGIYTLHIQSDKGVKAIQVEVAH